jgi:hypothetical protein
MVGSSLKTLGGEYDNRKNIRHGRRICGDRFQFGAAGKAVQAGDEDLGEAARRINPAMRREPCRGESDLPEDKGSSALITKKYRAGIRRQQSGDLPGKK